MHDVYRHNKNISFQISICRTKAYNGRGYYMEAFEKIMSIKVMRQIEARFNLRFCEDMYKRDSLGIEVEENK